nr:hypothetical protein Iba_chr07eCG8640 [Ipomoea batatas]
MILGLKKSSIVDTLEFPAVHHLLTMIIGHWTTHMGSNKVSLSSIAINSSTPHLIHRELIMPIPIFVMSLIVAIAILELFHEFETLVKPLLVVIVTIAILVLLRLESLAELFLVFVVPVFVIIVAAIAILVLFLDFETLSKPLLVVMVTVAILVHLLPLESLVELFLVFVVLVFVMVVIVAAAIAFLVPLLDAEFFIELVLASIILVFVVVVIVARVATTRRHGDVALGWLRGRNHVVGIRVRHLPRDAQDRVYSFWICVVEEFENKVSPFAYYSLDSFRVEEVRESHSVEMAVGFHLEDEFVDTAEAKATVPPRISQNVI